MTTSKGFKDVTEQYNQIFVRIIDKYKKTKNYSKILVNNDFTVYVWQELYVWQP